MVLPEEYLLESHAFLHHLQEVNQGHLLLAIRANHSITEIFYVFEVYLVELRSEAQNLCVHLSRLPLDDLLFSEDADRVDLCEGDHFLLRSVVVNSMEVCVWKNA